MKAVNAIHKLQQAELDIGGVEGSKSWHHQYRHSAYINIGGIHDKLSEGDIITVFSQFGEVVDLNYARDRQTGKPRGFAFLGYEDQRSTIMAVDNMNGYDLVGRRLRVDHVTDYKAPKILSETDFDEEGNPVQLEYKPTGAEGEGYQEYNKLESQKKIEAAAKEARKQREKHRRAELAAQDEAWAKGVNAVLMELPPLDDDDAAGKKTKKDKKDKKEKKKEKKAAKKEKRKEKKAAKKEAKKKRKKESSSSSSSSSSSDDG